MERADIALITFAAGGFGGKEAADAFQKMKTSYASPEEKAELEAKQQTATFNSLQRLFGG